MTDKPLKPLGEVVHFNDLNPNFERGLVLKVFSTRDVLVIEDPELYRVVKKLAQYNREAQAQVSLAESLGELASSVGLSVLTEKDITNKEALKRYQGIKEQMSQRNPERR